MKGELLMHATTPNIYQGKVGTQGRSNGHCPHQEIRISAQWGSGESQYPMTSWSWKPTCVEEDTERRGYTAGHAYEGHLV
eukprot:1155672-Pelagomonas_calceolata.AAC.12